MASLSASHSRMLPSTSVNSNVTIPEGSPIRPLCTPPGVDPRRQLQRAPFRVKTKGEVSLLVNVPVKPTVAVPPGGMVALYEALVTRTASPDWVYEPFHSWEI